MTTAPPHHLALRRVGWSVVGAALIGSAGWITLRNLRLPTDDGWFFWVPIAGWLVTMGLLCWWTALAHQATTRARIRASWRAGWVLGAAGLAIGFFGPLLVTPKANLGPLLGILITGPGAFVLGVLAGALTSRNP
ncbi:MAG: hypothetical protein ACJ8AX_16905 [Gemmatimonadales bacterium]